MMWGRKGGRSLIEDKTAWARIIRILIAVFVAGGVIIVIALAWRMFGARAVAGQSEGAPARGFSALNVADRESFVSGALIMGAQLPHALDAGWRGARVCEPLFENSLIRSARCTFPPGVGHERHWHPPHWGYIVSGATMRITDKTGTADRVLTSGTSWWSDGIEWHEALNIGETTGVYVIIEPKTGREG